MVVEVEVEVEEEGFDYHFSLIRDSMWVSRVISTLLDVSEFVWKHVVCRN